MAAVELGAGLFGAWDAVTRAVITAGQNFINAVLTLNPANIFAAVVGGVQGVVASFAVGGQLAIDGIVAAQTTLATALAARPVPVPLASTSLRAARPAAAAGASNTEAVSTPRRTAARTVQRDSAAADITAPSPKNAAAAGRRAARSGAAS